jgi:hypothetical protein
MNKTKLGQFAIMFALMMLMFFAIEVVPLHFGAKQIPWGQVPAHLQKRLPVMLLIAGAAAAWLVFVKNNQHNKKQ